MGTLSKSSLFSFDGNNWRLNSGGNTINLSDYGITLKDTKNKPTIFIYVYCDTVNNVVTNWEFTQNQNEIYIGGAKRNNVII